MHSVLFLVLDFLFVAALYVLLGAPFLAAIQVLVYAGGIVVLYLFVVMLVNLKRPPEAHQDPRRLTKLGFGLSVAVLVELGGDCGVQLLHSGVAGDWCRRRRCPCRGTPRRSGWLLYTSYLIPVRNRVDAAAGRDDRRHSAGEEGTVNLVIGSSSHLVIDLVK